MIENLKNLFGLRAVATENNTEHYNPDNRQPQETYVAYGRRMCGKVNGSVHALQPLLHRVYCSEKQRQRDDEQLQESHRNRLRDEITNLRSRIDTNHIEQQRIQGKIADENNRDAETRDRLQAAKGNIGEANKMAKIKMIIGMIILMILTVYLFVFYSSTFYSAFFNDFSDIKNLLVQAMFNSQAIPLALGQGILCLVFICCAPIIFMGLGYMLHFYSVEKGKAKYFKIIATVVITFLFDCILAYLIAKNIYNVEALTKIDDQPPYEIGMALTDMNVWAVIFCGFITYMIWGFVFDLTISAYEELRTNRKEIKILEQEIARISKEKGRLEDQLSNQRVEEANLQSRLNMKESQLNQHLFILDENAIRTEMVNFFSGWITTMSALGLPSQMQANARKDFDNTVNQLITNQ